MDSPNLLAGPASIKTPLSAILLFTFANSIGTGLVNSGVFFITKATYGFSEIQNLCLAVGLGIAYIIGAKGAGPVIRTLRQCFPRFTSCRFLMGLMCLMALLCCIPPLLTFSGIPERSTLGFAGIACLVLLYSPLSGALWPMVESYISGGRQGEELRSAMGMWNVVWSSAVPLAYWSMRGFIESHTVLAFVGLVAVHLSLCLVLVRFQREPASHVHTDLSPSPPMYRRLLSVLRYLLPMSYVASSAIGPILPELLAGLGVKAVWCPVLGSAWLAPRPFAFLIFQRWQGWHGTWLAPILGTVMVFVGFAVAVLSPMLGASMTSIVLVVAGLGVFGAGSAVIYSAAIYYAMEVGNSEVEAGGNHEALIGIGYTVGPLCGLAGAGLAGLGLVSGQYERAAVVGIVALIGIGVALLAWRQARNTL